jgi:hypothetical protein
MGVAHTDTGAMDARAKRKALVFTIMRAVALASVVIALGLYACAERPAPRPRVVTAPPRLPAVTPAPPPVIQNNSGGWEDWPATPGDWAYRQDPRGSVALFGAPGRDAMFLVRCDTTARKIYASRTGTFPPGETGRMTIRASTGLQTYPVANTQGATPYVAAELQPMDRHLDAMAFSRGRFVVSVKGSTDLVIPAWPELTRVVEDCRG